MHVVGPITSPLPPLLVVAVSSIAPPVIGEVEATPVDSRVALAELLARSNQPRYESTVLR